MDLEEKEDEYGGEPCDRNCQKLDWKFTFERTFRTYD